MILYYSVYFPEMTEQSEGNDTCHRQVHWKKEPCLDQAEPVVVPTRYIYTL